jgi:SAM-dependent methyltransferase
MTQTLNTPAQPTGDPWGARARDWAEVEDEGSRNLFEAVLDAVGVADGMDFLDVGCGSGLACELAAARGARPSGLDASPGLLAIAAERTPAADLRRGDMASLPWPDASFDAVAFVNSLFFASDQIQALREAARVAREGARVAAVVWTSPERVEATAYLDALAPLLPPLPSVVDPFAQAPQLIERARRAGLVQRRVFEIEWTWEYPDAETLLRGWLSVGLSSLAIANAGVDAVRRALLEAAEPYRLTAGGYRLENTCHCLIGIVRKEKS